MEGLPGSRCLPLAVGLKTRELLASRSSIILRPPDPLHMHPLSLHHCPTTNPFEVTFHIWTNTEGPFEALPPGRADFLVTNLPQSDTGSRRNPSPAGHSTKRRTVVLT
jgi:hypothetical protein